MRPLVSRPGSRGFTLLEVLVVLVITSMMSVMLIDGVSQVLMIERRLSQKTDDFRSAELRQFWFRQLLSGGMASKEYPFKLKEGRVSGLTLSPLQTESGIPTPFELALVATGDFTELRYRERDGEYLSLQSWPQSELINPPRFLVVNKEGTYSPGWVSNEGQEQWPAGFALQMPLLQGEEFWHVAIIGRRTPRLDVTDILGI
ncbi:MAG: prepilin-type N-terminal cleavage/methylation domain-containing protein [Halieaceae bacterium]